MHILYLIANKIQEEDLVAQGWVNSCSVQGATFQSPLKAGKPERPGAKRAAHSRTWLSELPQRKAAPLRVGSPPRRR